MADVTPLKAVYESNDAVALGEFTATDTLPVNLLDPATLRSHLGLSTVATSGSYNDLSDTPPAGGSSLSADQEAAISGANAPSASNVFATIADVGGGSGDLSQTDIDTLAKLNAIVTDATLVNATSLSTVATSGSYNDLSDKPTGAGSGDMTAATYDPTNVAADAFSRANHTGEQAISTVTGLQSALDDRLEAADIDTLADLNTIVTDATLVDVAGDNTWTGQQTFSGGAKEVWSALTGTTPAIGQGNYTWTLSGNSTPTSALTDGESTTIHIAGTTSTIDWSSTVDQWIGGSEPALPETGEAVIVLWKQGGTVTGTHLGNAS